MKRLYATVHGRVQGVYFRHYTQLEADRLGLSGWVRNEFDGSVAVVAEGGEAALRSFLDFLHRGPPSARVERVDQRWAEASGEFTGFGVR
jgi:acylphosphatase